MSNASELPNLCRRLLSAIAALGIAAFGLSMQACNTTEGVGEDIRAAGDAIDDAAEDAND